MATIVKYKSNGQYYILLGTSYSYFKDTSPSFFGGTLFPNEDEGLFNQAAVTNENGNIIWLPIDELIVIEVDGVKVGTMLSGFKNNHTEDFEECSVEDGEKCPGCGGLVDVEDKMCPYCGLTLILEE